MTISWYPRHMNQARKEIERALPKVDLIVEILDARLPQASANPVLQELRGEKPALILLNKSDLADGRRTKEWLEHFERRVATRAQPLIAADRGQVQAFARRIRQMTREPKPGRPVRVLIVGIPNVGKSTLLNSLRRRKVARVGDEPAVTKGQQIVEISPGLRIIDTPGLLWPRMDDEARAYRLAASGAIKDVAIDEIEVATFLTSFLIDDYPELLTARYKVALPLHKNSLLEEIGQRRGCLVQGGGVELGKAARILLADLRSGRLGRITFERAPTRARE